MSELGCVSGERLAFVSAAVASGIAQEFNINDLVTLGAFFSSIGDNLSLIAAQRQKCCPVSPQSVSVNPPQSQ